MEVEKKTQLNNNETHLQKEKVYDILYSGLKIIAAKFNF